MAELMDKLISNPTEVFGSNKLSSKEAFTLVKQFLDPIAASNSVLDEIYTEGLDSSQVWGQVRLVVEGANQKLLAEEIPDLREKFGTVGVSDEEEEDDDDDDLEEGEEEEEIDIESDDQEDASDEENQIQDKEEEDDDEEDIQGQSPEEDDDEEVQGDKPPKHKKDAFGLNDGFFDIDEFNKQVLAMEDDPSGTGVTNDNNDEEIDFFADVDDDEESDEEEVAYHDDFFKGDKKKGGDKKVKFASKREEDEEDIFDDDGQFLEKEYDKAMGSTMMDLFADEDQEEINDEEEGEDGMKNLSTFQRQQRQIQKEIAQLEKEAVAEKKWALKGEVKAKDRPSDALLKEDLEFERTAKPVPVITKEITESIEDLIRRRVKEQQFDELQKRLISDVANFKKSRKFDLSEEKSSKSLAELYEDEYNGGATADSTATNDELTKAHAEISQLFQSLTHKLDALSSAHFIPKPAQKTLDIKVEGAAISMEDAQPLTMSNANTLAPQELFNVKTGSGNNEISLKSGLVISKDELSRDEKQRMRRLNKRKRSKEYKNKQEQHQPAASDSNKRSKKSDVIDTLSKAKNLTVINNKGEKRDAKGNLVKEQRTIGSSGLKL